MDDVFSQKYSIIYADPPWEYRQCGNTAKSRGNAIQHYPTMATDDICALPVSNMIDHDGTALFLWATFPNISEALRVISAWGFEYKTAAFVWVKKNVKSDSNFWGMGAYTRANAEVCLLAVSKGYKATNHVISHAVHQIIESPIERRSKKPDVVRGEIEKLMGDVP